MRRPRCDDERAALSLRPRAPDPGEGGDAPARWATAALALTLALATACRDHATGTSPDRAAVPPASPPSPLPGPSSMPGAGTTPPSPPGPPVVDLGGRFQAPPPPSPAAYRIGSLAMETAVHEQPDPGSRRVGTLRAGAVVEAERRDAGTVGCPGGWRPLRPYGFVCLGSAATDDLQHPVVRATARRPDPSHKLPYMYGTVTRGGPVYARLPTAEDLARFEPGLASHLARWAEDEESGATYGLDVWLKWRRDPAPPALEALRLRVTDPDLPFFLAGGQSPPRVLGPLRGVDTAALRQGAVKVGQVDRRTGVAFVESFLHEGRRYNVTPELLVIPADRFRPIRGSDFHGYEIGKDINFPFALVRKPGGKKWRVHRERRRLVAEEDLPYRAAIPLTGKQQFFDGKLHYQTTDGFWIDDRHAGRVEPARRMPKWGKNGEKWIDVNLTKQVLVAYEGTKPVFVTLVSSGEGGLGDPQKTRATLRGIFRIHTKHLTATMDSDAVGEEFELRDIPYVQYFQDGYALHAAYWHDTFGTPRSHGCINLSPEDARRLFHWTEPALPHGWHGVARALTGTVVFVHP